MPGSKGKIKIDCLPSDLNLKGVANTAAVGRFSYVHWFKLKTQASDILML